MVTKSMKWQGELQGEEARMVMQDVAARSDKILDKAGPLPSRTFAIEQRQVRQVRRVVRWVVRHRRQIR